MMDYPPLPPGCGGAGDVIEYDSDEEEQPGADLSSWLAQLDENASQPGSGMEGEKSILTQSHTMESFRYSVMMDLDDGGLENLDDILSDLCALQEEITHTEEQFHQKGQISPHHSSYQHGSGPGMAVAGPQYGRMANHMDPPSSAMSTLTRSSDKDSGNGDDIPGCDMMLPVGSHRYSASSDYPSSNISAESPPRAASPDRNSLARRNRHLQTYPSDNLSQLPPPPESLLFPASNSEMGISAPAIPLPPRAKANGRAASTSCDSRTAVVRDGGSRRAPLLGQMKEKALSAPTGQPISAKERDEKIRIAMQKIKEADIRKLFVKIFIQTGDFKTILVDDRMESHDVVHVLLDKCYFSQNVKWTLIEQLPDLFMERIVEDHEKIVQVMANWLRVSNNKILFLETDDKYDLFFQPQNYLLNRAAAAKCPDRGKQQALVNDVFSNNGTGCQTPELEGDIYMKVDGQKTWRKVRVVLRESGLYSRKSKSSKTLTLLAEFSKVDIYRGFNWRKKMRSPSDYCFALKEPKLQKKSKDIKYFCVDDDYQLKKWLMNLRIAKYGPKLSENFRRALGGPGPSKSTNDSGGQHTDAPSDSSSQSSRDSGFSGGTGSSNSLDRAAAAAAAANRSRMNGNVILGGPPTAPLPPPPAAFSDSNPLSELPPPPPELLDTSSTPTNTTPVHFASPSSSSPATVSSGTSATMMMTDAFRRLHASDDYNGFSSSSPPRHSNATGSNSSTPRNSVSSADSSTLGSSSPRSSAFPIATSSSTVSGTVPFSPKRPSLPIGFRGPERACSGPVIPVGPVVGGGPLRASTLSRASSSAAMMVASNTAKSQPGPVRAGTVRAGRSGNNAPPPVPGKTSEARAQYAAGYKAASTGSMRIPTTDAVTPYGQVGHVIGGRIKSTTCEDDNDPSSLPPPPPELLQPEYSALENHYSVPSDLGINCGPRANPAFPGNHYGTAAAGTHQPLCTPGSVSRPHIPPVPVASQYGSFTPPTGGNTESHYASIGAGGSMRLAPPIVLGESNGVDQYSMGRVFASHQTGTIKRAPPALPKRSGSTISSQPRR